jgi:hypothetical protein
VQHLRGYRQDPTNYLRETYPDIFLDLGGTNCAIASGEDHWTKTHMMNSVIHPITGKEIQYKDLMKIVSTRGESETATEHCRYVVPTVIKLPLRSIR